MRKLRLREVVQLTPRHIAKSGFCQVLIPTALFYLRAHTWPCLCPDFPEPRRGIHGGYSGRSLLSIEPHLAQRHTGGSNSGKGPGL